MPYKPRVALSMEKLVRRVLIALDRVSRWGAMLSLPLAALLCVQWPLRDWLGSGSRQANDMAQWVFALYVALAIRHATRLRAHMSAAALAARYPRRVHDVIARFGPPLCLLPWTVFVIVSAAAPAWRSLVSLEAFPDTSNPGYFVIRCGVWLLAWLLALQTLADLLADPETAQAGGR